MIGNQNTGLLIQVSCLIEVATLTGFTVPSTSQVDEMKKDLYAKDGEIKILRDKLSGQESELNRMKSEKIGQIAQQNKQQKDKEKALQV